MYKLLLILLLAFCTANCGILNGNDDNEDVERSDTINEALINGKPWQDYHPHDPIRNDTVYSNLMTLLPSSDNYLLSIRGRLRYESPYWESLNLHIGFPADMNFEELELPYTVNYLESSYERESFRFVEYDWDVIVQPYRGYDTLHPPVATITQFDLESGVVEVEFEGTLILEERYRDQDYPSRWKGVDTLRITEGRFRTIHAIDRRDE